MKVLDKAGLEHLTKGYNAKIASKADKTTTYTKQEMDTKLNIISDLEARITQLEIYVNRKVQTWEDIVQ